MAVYRFRDGWKAEVFFEGKRVDTKAGFAKRDEAKRWHDDRLARFRGGEVNENVSVPRTFDDALESFEARHMPTVSASSAVIYRSVIANHIRPFFRFARLDKLTPDVFDSFKLELAAKLSASTANDCLMLVHLILERAVRARLISANPFDVDLLAEPEREFQWWDDGEDIRRFLRQAEGSRYYAAYFLALETGLRFGEVVGLWKQSIDFERGAIFVERQWKQNLRAYGLPKYQKTRWVYFDPAGPFAEALTVAAKASRHPQLVFASRGGHHLLRSKLGDAYLSRLIEKAGVPALTFHGLRHTFASWYMRTHDDVWALMSLMGHTRIETTMRYAHHGATRRHKPLGLVPSHTNHAQIREVKFGS